MYPVNQAFVNPMVPSYTCPYHGYVPYRVYSYSPYLTGYPAAYPPVYPPYFDHERFSSLQGMELKDYGKQPVVLNIEKATEQNNTFRTALWTGKHMQVTLMSIPVGSSVGLEVHPDTDQVIRIEDGDALIEMGDTSTNLNFRTAAEEGYAIMIPAGKWHNVTNTGDEPLKICVFYAPPQHPFGTVHRTKADAMAAEQASS